MARPASTAHFTAPAHIKPNAGSRELIARGSDALMLCETTSNRLTLKVLGCRTSLTASIELQRRRAPPSSSVHAGCSVCPLPPQRRHCPRPVSWLSFLRTKRAALRGNGTPRRLDLHPHLAGRGRMRRVGARGAARTGRGSGTPARRFRPRSPCPCGQRARRSPRARG